MICKTHLLNTKAICIHLQIRLSSHYSTHLTKYSYDYILKFLEYIHFHLYISYTHFICITLKINSVKYKFAFNASYERIHLHSKLDSI